MPNYKAHNTMTPKPLLERLWRKTIIDSNTSCWLWQGFCDKGYGYIRWNKRKTIGVHVASASIFRGHEPTENKKILICHKPKCPNKNCWNPEHIYIGTSSMNQLDRTIMHTHFTPPGFRGIDKLK